MLASVFFCRTLLRRLLVPLVSPSPCLLDSAANEDDSKMLFLLPNSSVFGSERSVSATEVDEADPDPLCCAVVSRVFTASEDAESNEFRPPSVALLEVEEADAALEDGGVLLLLFTVAPPLRTELEAAPGGAGPTCTC